jgi:hypothetical protein
MSCFCREAGLLWTYGCKQYRLIAPGGHRRNNEAEMRLSEEMNLIDALKVAGLGAHGFV